MVVIELGSSIRSPGKSIQREMGRELGLVLNIQGKGPQDAKRKANAFFMLHKVTRMALQRWHAI